MDFRNNSKIRATELNDGEREWAKISSLRDWVNVNFIGQDMD